MKKKKKKKKKGKKKMGKKKGQDFNRSLTKSAKKKE